MKSSTAEIETAEITDEIKETKNTITPYALTIDSSLIGMPLARPWKRAIAILIDIILVGFLSLFDAAFLFFACACIAFAHTRENQTKNESLYPVMLRKKLKNKTRVFIRTISIITLVVTPLVLAGSMIAKLSNTDTPNSRAKPAENSPFEDQIEFWVTRFAIGEVVKKSNCDSKECYQKEIKQHVMGMVKFNLNETQITTIVNQYLEQTDLAQSDKSQIGELTVSEYLSAVKSEGNQNSRAFQPGPRRSNVPEADRSTSPSIISWAKGILEEFGLGFGWAAFYFTVLTSLWQGQTMGKKLMRLKVVQTNASPISLWDSFGRYGGYGAGFATGLLGFLQVYWDSNRQAIQDKISETVVIDLSKIPTQPKN